MHINLKLHQCSTGQFGSLDEKHGCTVCVLPSATPFENILDETTLSTLDEVRCFPRLPPRGRTTTRHSSRASLPTLHQSRWDSGGPRRSAARAGVPAPLGGYTDFAGGEGTARKSVRLVGGQSVPKRVSASPPNVSMNLEWTYSHCLAVWAYIRRSPVTQSLDM